MTNEVLKDRLVKLGINKKEFAEKFNISQSAVNNWSSKPIPSWVDAVVDLLDRLHECKQQTLNDIYNEQKKQNIGGFINEDEMDERDEKIEELFKRLDAIEKNQSK